MFWFELEVQSAVQGELLNISGSGAAVIAEVNLPNNDSLWFGLGKEALFINSIESKLVVISLDPCGTKVVRLRFVDSCPMELFELAVHGSKE